MQGVKSWEGLLAARNLRRSRPRREIAEVLFRAQGHLTAEELHHRVRREHPRIGLATVYRTLRLLCEGGLCRELKLEDGTARYEPMLGQAHHDHLICTRCGRVLEVVDPEIERLQEKLFSRHGFFPLRHRLELYGLCRNCRPKAGGTA